MDKFPEFDPAGQDQLDDLMYGYDVALTDAGQGFDATATGNITSRSLTLEATGIPKVYDGTTHTGVTFTDDRVFINGEGDILTINSTAKFVSKNVSIADDVIQPVAINVTNIFLTGDDAANYSLLTITLATEANITQAPLTVTANDAVKNFGTEKDPDLTYAITEGILFSSDEITGSLEREPGEDVDSYPITGDLDAGTNYNLLFYPGTFYINPFGPGTRAVKPVLNCIEELGVGSNYFRANFGYKNDNAYDVYIPVGDDNLLEGGVDITFTDMDDKSLEHQPELFESGGGYFRVYFYGDHLTWTVNSLDEDHKASHAANANSSSTKCQSAQKSAWVSTGMEEEEILALEDLMVYPNPVADKVNLTMKDIQDYEMIMLLDLTGKAHPITSIKKRSDRLEIEMSELAPGPYFFRVVLEDTSRVIQVIKQ